jgi:hypothetical protein
MKRCLLPALSLALVLSLGVACSSAPTPDSGDRTRISPSASSPEFVASVLAVELDACGRRIPSLAKESVRTFSEDRIKKTLHGIWRGRVWGKYDEKFLDEKGFLKVDYYMVVDTDRGEVLVIEQLSDERSAPPPSDELRKAGALPVWSYLMCGKEQYLPPHPPQVHEFQKVSNDIADARTMLAKSTGLKISDAVLERDGLVVSKAWQQLVDGKYFDDLRFPAYAGGLFKPFEIRNMVNEAGQPVFQLRFDTELRGGGKTAAQFESGEPIMGWEAAQFVGVSTADGDFLISSAGNGAEYKKVSTSGGVIDVFFEKVVIGPLAQ